MSTATAPDSRDILGNARFSSFSGSSSSAYAYADAPNASSILGATSNIDPAALHPLAGLIDSKDLDYLALDDDKLSGVEGGQSVLPSRGWSDELCYGTGSTYLCGLAGGGIWGLYEGFRRPILPKAGQSIPIGSINPAAAAATSTATSAAGVPPASSIGAQATAFAQQAAAGSSTPKGTVPPEAAAGSATANSASKISRRLRWNHVLNQVTRRGSFTGNSAGVLALIYNGFNSTLDSYRGGKHDIYGSMAAGAMTGALWRCTAGVKPMIISSGLLTVGAAAWTTVKLQFL
ncbi:BQ5605_C021g09332 [Microbotryum silenes-dioicae]|uniref:BQ5605_C021g09332 protein n=1 Tax=Microbotryum silenes-dioicae TaxID=796604 RepID=A0A2X0N688_9BASI|nr:BQ5605_C021g09332 [Microbotryum silenes-dioicae]